ncbi:DUF421 domain-containing protein [Halobacillus litoralis]|uniref:DUF421 domain-containing protein n=1 Tax=Halobacillus litoralis TaxID=45668 RepID=A0A845EA48_9BACI|nr:DUF421 domain-containing protein [Halobacillus litoralis]MYL48168.1 DUF421 domain-containing protein [Halobacillus litoralis]
MDEWLEFVGTGVTVFILLYVLARILSKKLISQMTLFDFIAGITLGSMTATTFLADNVTLLKGALGLLTFAALVLLIDYLTLKSLTIRKLVNSQPTLLMDNGKIIIKNMKKVRFNIDELIAELRKAGVFQFSEVQTAILETDGSVSVLRKSDVEPLTPRDMKLEPKPVTYSHVVMVQGKVLLDQLNASGYSESWLEDRLQSHGVSDHKEVLVAQVNADGTLFVEKME